MSWIVAAVKEGAGQDLPAEAVTEFRLVAKANPAAPWKLETGHLRAGREFLEEKTGRSWAEVDLKPDEVREVYDVLASEDRKPPQGLGAAVVGFLEVCVRHGFALEGGVGARRMRR